MVDYLLNVDYAQVIAVTAIVATGLGSLILWLLDLEDQRKK